MTTEVTTPTDTEIRIERVFDADRERVFAVWTDPELIPEWWEDTTVEEMDVRAGGRWRFRTAHGVVEGEFHEVVPPARIVQTMRFDSTEDRDTTMGYGVEKGAEAGFARIDVLLAQRVAA